MPTVVFVHRLLCVFMLTGVSLLIGCQPNTAHPDRLNAIELRHAHRTKELRQQALEAKHKSPPQPQIPRAWGELMASDCDVGRLVHHQVVASALLRYPSAAQGEPVDDPALHALFEGDGGWYAPDISQGALLPLDVKACLLRLQERHEALASEMPMSEAFLAAQRASPRIFGALWRATPGSHLLVQEEEDHMEWFAFHGCAWERRECFVEGVFCERDSDGFDCYPSGDILPLVLGDRWLAGDAAEVLAGDAAADESEEWSTMVHGELADAACPSCEPARVGRELSVGPQSLDALFDDDPETAVCWPAKSAAFALRLNEPMPVGDVAFLGGHFGSAASLASHGRVKTLSISVDGAAAGSFEIADAAASPRSLQELTTTPLRPFIPLREGQEISVGITGVHPGVRGDVCLSDFWIYVLPEEYNSFGAGLVHELGRGG